MQIITVIEIFLRSRDEIIINLDFCILFEIDNEAKSLAMLIAVNKDCEVCSDTTQ